MRKVKSEGTYAAKGIESEGNETKRRENEASSFEYPLLGLTSGSFALLRRGNGGDGALCIQAGKAPNVPSGGQNNNRSVEGKS